ncbi:MAG: formylglycine-generating enzyme family protein [Candidatus Hydrogenedentes bacterium]|nr:formylglycine-generating enzyme family protein [Candidatus Hydrogenedentota bacterium]
MSYGFRGRMIHVVTLLCLVLSCDVEKKETPQSSAVPTSTAASVKSDEGTAITTTTGVKMAAVPPGEFLMGNDSGEADERPPHTVKIDKFYIDVYEVTQQSYETLMGTNPSKHKDPQQPVEQLGWLAAIKYCNMRSLKEGLKPCYNLDTLACDFAANGYRLPTEAEWEYACRAGTTSEYSFAGGESKLAEAAWFDANANGRPHPVGQKPANAWGLYDMHGNVSEWCYDVYSENYYASSPRENPCNTGGGEERVLRGGAWNSAVDACRSSARWSETPGLADVCFGYDAYGFRCVKRAGA